MPSSKDDADYLSRMRAWRRRRLAAIPVAILGFALLLLSWFYLPPVTRASNIQGSQPIVCGSRALTGQTGSIATTTVCTAPVKGLYRVSYYFVVTTAAAVGTIALTQGWTDAVAARSVASATVTLTTTGFSNSALARPGVIALQAEAGSAITFDVTLAAVVGSPVYDVYVSAELLR
jgi:hypothetical protein